MSTESLAAVAGYQRVTPPAVVSPTWIPGSGVRPGAGVGRLRPGHVERRAQVPGGLLARGDVPLAGGRWPGGRPGAPGDGDQVG